MCEGRRRPAPRSGPRVPAPPGPGHRRQPLRLRHTRGSQRHITVGHTTSGDELFEDLDDDELLLLAARRPEAFGAFYERHAEDLLRFFAKRTFDPDAAAELTSETFAAAFVARMRFRPKGAGATGWLYGIGRHQLSRYFRRAAVDSRARRKLGMPERVLSDADYERIEELMDLQDIRRVVGTAFGRLSDDQREAVTLHVVEGRPYPEVAEMLGLTQEAARARVSRGLRRLESLVEVRQSDVQTGGELT